MVVARSEKYYLPSFSAEESTLKNTMWPDMESKSRQSVVRTEARNVYAVLKLCTNQIREFVWNSPLGTLSTKKPARDALPRMFDTTC